MEFRHLRCFTVLAEELHFGRAAQRLAMTQPPLSMNIQQLEADVGARLFERNSRGVALTAAGLAFLPRALALLEQAALAAREARDVGQGLAGQLQIGFAGTVLYRGLPQVLRDFAAAHPRLRLALRELSSSEQLVELVHDRLDLGFVHTTRVPAGFSQILVSSQPFMACLPSNHPQAKKKQLSLDQLKGDAFAIVMRAVSPDYHDRILAACADAGFEPALAFELRHWLSVVSVIAQGLGVGLVPAALQQAGLPGVVFVPLAQPLAPYDTHCLWRTGRDQTAQGALGAFLAAVQVTAQTGHHRPTPEPNRRTTMSNTQTLVLGGGCFWCTESVYKEVRGVTDVESGYSNGQAHPPSYEEVCTGTTGCNEVVKLVYDPAQVSTRELLEIFFVIHDPTTPNRQGNDTGTQYRSGIYVTTDEQRAFAQALIDELTADNAFGRPIVTELLPLAHYWPAEDYHQDFFERHPHQGYCMAVAAPKVAKFRKTFTRLAK